MVHCLKGPNYGTFEGKVILVKTTINYNGKKPIFILNKSHSSIKIKMLSEFTFDELIFYNFSQPISK